MFFRRRSPGTAQPGHGLSDGRVTARRLRWAVRASLGGCWRRHRCRWRERSIWALAASLARSFCRTWTKAPSGRAALWRTAPVFPKGEKFTNNERYVFASFPEVKTVVSEVGRPDDGTDTGGFGNTEYFVDLKPHDQWRPVFHKNKEELIAAMNRAVQKYPGRDLELLAADRRQRRRNDDRHQGLRWRSRSSAMT